VPIFESAEIGIKEQGQSILGIFVYFYHLVGLNFKLDYIYKTSAANQRKRISDMTKQ